MKKNEKIWMNKKSYILLLAVIFVLAAYIIYPSTFIQTLATATIPDLSTSGFVEVNISVEVGDDHGVVSMGNNCYVVSAEVERSQAISIQNGIDGKVGPRPNSHDLFNDLIKNLDIEILMVKITNVEDNSYHSKFIFRQGNTILNLDARPSDAIAISSRTDYIVHIYMNETLLKEVGTKIC
jgi:bifunctional DNase/RNase